MATPARRRKNPSAWWLVPTVIVTAGAVSAGIWAWSTRKKRTYVGSGWDWPSRNLFPTEMSFGESLAILGYGSAFGLPGWEILSTATMETVMAFQRDFNQVRQAFQIQAIIDELAVDGLIGENTVRAFEFALDQNRAEGGWITLVQEARMRNAGVLD